MRKIILIISTVFSYPAFSLEWQGYRPVEQLDKPFVAYAQNSVVQVIALGVRIDPNTTPQIVDISTAPQFADSLVGAPEQLGQGFPNMWNMQIENCRNQGIKKCPVFNSYSRSTGFFEADGKIMNACRHPFQRWFYDVSQANPGEDPTRFSPAILIYNSNGRLIYNGVRKQPSEFLRVDFINKERHLIFDYEEPDISPNLFIRENFIDSDIVQFRADRPVVDPFPVTIYRDVVPAPTSYLVGYPASEGNTLVASVGRVIDGNSHTGSINLSNQSSRGISGGPSFDDEGGILGMHCGQNGEVKPPEYYSMGIFINRHVLRSHWNSMYYDSVTN